MEDSDDDSLILAGMQSDNSDAGSDEEDFFEFNGDLSSDIAPNVEDMDELCRCLITNVVFKYSN